MSPNKLLANPHRVDPSLLPPFYKALLKAWMASEGAFSVALRSLVVGSLSGLTALPVTGISCKLVYTFLVAKHVEEPHCVQKCAPVFGSLYWPHT